MKINIGILLISVMILSVSLMLGCSSGGSQSIPVVPDDSQQITGNADNTPDESAAAGHYLMSYGMIYVDPTDPDNPEFDVIPLRATSIHLNILKFLEVGPCTDCFKITGATKIEPLHFTMDIEITHPLPEMIFTAFDARAIIMFNGSHIFTDSGLSCSDNTLGDSEFVDPDGYTALHNSSTLGVAPGDFFGYFQGKIATPTLPDATLNGYRRYITNDPANTRNALYNGDAVTQSIELRFGANPFALGYAVDACWAPPIIDPVTNPMTDFGPDANCEEPWNLDVADLGTGLFELCGNTTLQIDVYDWQGKSTHGDPVIECSDLFAGNKTATWVSDESGFTRYEINITNENAVAAGVYKLLTSVEANENDPVGKPWLDLTSYQVTDITVHPDEVTIPDPGLDGVIRAELGLGPSDPILRCDLNSITELVGQSLSISNLEGIQYCENLTLVRLGTNNISDITLMEYLTNLQNLFIFSNQIVDLSPLQNLTSLSQLNLNGNDISDLSPLQNLTNLTELEFFGNNVVDLSPIAGLTNITELQIGANSNITDISPLASLVNLEYLGMDYCPVGDISAVQNFPNLGSLQMSGCSVTQITPVSGLTNLWEFLANGNQIDDISPLQGLTNLSAIELINNQISDLTPLTLNAGLGAGDSLKAEENPLDCESLNSDIPTLIGNGVTVTSDDPQIVFPDSGLDAAIRSALALGPADPIYKTQLCPLTFFNAIGAGITNLEGLQYCDNIDQLELFDNSLTDISELQYLTNLTGLWMWNNQISDISPLQGLTNIINLSVAANNLTDISPVQFLVQLDRIDLQSNSGIIDAEPLWNCHLAGGLQAGSDVLVNGTGLVPGDTWLNQLIAAGVNVVY